MAKKGKSSYVKMQQGSQRSSNVRTKQEKAPSPNKGASSGQRGTAKRKGFGLMEHLKFYPEYRRDGQTTPPLEEGAGRFKYFWSVGKRRNSSILIANLMFIIFALPLVAVFVTVLALGGVENIAYLMKDISAPYLMTNIGFGISTSALSFSDVSRYIAEVYYLIFAAAGVGALILSVGLSGMMPLCMNFILGDTFISKKDNYGNDVPRAILEFFRGLKKYWWQFLIVGFFMLVLVAGVGNAFVFFISSFKLGEAGVGHWFLIIFAAIIALLGLMFLAHLMPTIVLYEMPFKDKLNNAAIFTIQMFVQNLFMVIAFAVPFVLIGVINNMIVSSIILAVLLVYGSKYYCLTMCNYEQYIAEKIVTPIYNAKFTSTKQKKNKKK